MTFPAPLLPHLAVAISQAFPELGGRAYAVSDAEITAENIPTLPLVMLAGANESYQSSKSSNKPTEIEETVVVKFMLAPVKNKRLITFADGSTAEGESPFWAFYDYTHYRDRLFDMLIEYQSPAGRRVTPRRLDIGSDQLAVELTFTLAHDTLWCGTATRPVVAAGSLRVTTSLTAAPEVECCICPNPSVAVAASCP